MLVDANPFGGYNSFANAHPGFYTPSPGESTMYHPQPGEFQAATTMALAHGMDTPMSMPTSRDGLQNMVNVMDVAGFQSLQNQFHHLDNNFLQAPTPAQHAQQPAFAPYVHHDTGYETMEQGGSPMGSDPSDARMQPMAAVMSQKKISVVPADKALPASAEKFMFQSILNAPTAMVKHHDEIPVTYLNKGQAYSLNIVDTSHVGVVQPGTKYRTFVRVSFEDDEQRQKPGVCWSLWKEGRGTNEAHQRGGKLQAVEHVEPAQPGDGDDKRTRIEVETSSFDGFSVIWTPRVGGRAEVNIAVRFNFLSTDFSHSKGVKGIPVRLCAKTTAVSPKPDATTDSGPEVCFCKVKLFRDHGAERKLSNDVAHVKKSIEKLQHQLAQLENGIKDVGKKKRHSGISKSKEQQRSTKPSKHSRTWSMSSTSSRPTVEEDLHFKMQALNDMFASTRLNSVLYLRGDELDDPDLHPVSLPGELSPRNRSDAIRDGSNWPRRSGQSSVTSSMVSPSPSSHSATSQASVMGSGGAWNNGADQTASAETGRKGPENPTKVAKTNDEGALTGWIEALGVDAAYRPPPERREKPVACFYVARHEAAESNGKTVYHKAVYLKTRSLEDLNARIASKWGLDASKIIQTTRIIHDGLEVEVDDDVVRELKEGQDMRLEVVEDGIQRLQAKRKWDSISTEGQQQDNVGTRVAGLVLRLRF